MSADIQAIKEANLIQEVIAETTGWTLRGNRDHLKAVEHDSLVVNVAKQLYFWNSQGHSGDVLSWLQNQQKMSFQDALIWLSKRAGLPLDWNSQDAKQWQAARARQDILTTIAGYLHGKLVASAAATEYGRGRGWSEETLAESGCGFWDGNVRALQEHLKLHEIDVKDEIVQAVCQMPREMFVYAHFIGGRCCYLTGRSIEGKRHWNLPAALAGDRQPYFNHIYSSRSANVVIVEGQADALSLGQWGIAAMALAGTSANDDLVAFLGRHDRLYVGLDADEAGQKNGMALARQLGALTRVLSWPVHDANEWLQGGAGADECRLLLSEAPLLAEFAAERVRQVDPLDVDKARRDAIDLIAELPEYVLAEKKRDLAQALDLTVTQFSGMLKAVWKEKEKETAAIHKIEMTAANGFVDDHLFELVYKRDDERGPRTLLAVRYPDGHVGITTRLETERYRITPRDASDPMIATGFLRLPDDLGDFKSETEVQQRVQAFIHKYVDLPDHIEKLASYYVMLTWLFDAFYVMPYLRARGDYDSGKSRFTEVVGELCMRSMFVTGMTTPSPVFRTMRNWNGCTVVMDEADLPHTETSADWVQMFNTGYKRGFGILRTAMVAGEATVEAFNAFGPKIINMRGRFPDAATESRCLTWETSSGRGIRPDIPRYMDRETFIREATDLRNMLLAYRLRTFTSIEVDYNNEKTREMPGRLVEITVPLMSITQSPEFKGSIMEFIEKMNQQAIMDRAASLPAKILEAILRAYYVPDALARKNDPRLQLQVAHITRQANMLMNSENDEALAEGEEVFRKKQLTAGGVGKILKNDLHLETEAAKVSSNRSQCLVWDIDRIGGLIVRYGMEDVVGDLMQEQARLEASEVEDVAQKHLI